MKEYVRERKHLVSLLSTSKEVVWRALDDGLGIMIGGDMNAHIWELNGV